MLCSDVRLVLHQFLLQEHCGVLPHAGVQAMAHGNGG